MAIGCGEKEDLMASVGIKAVEMPDDLKESAVRVVEAAMKEGGALNETAKRIKTEFDRLHGSEWQCVIGRNYGSFIGHQRDRFIFLYCGKEAVLLFQSS